MTPSFSEAKRFTAKPSATSNVASSAAGSSASAASAETPSTKPQAPSKLQVFFIRKIRKSRQFVGQRGDLALSVLDQRHEFLHFSREPANGRVAIITAARLLGSVAAEKGPILRTPII